MQPDRILDLLGRPSTDAGVSSLLDAFALRWRPELDPEKPDRYTDWYPVRELGIEFGFEDEAYLNAEDPARRNHAPLIFFEVIFYGEHPRMQAYRDELPFGLFFSDDQRAVRQRLAPLNTAHRFFLRDVWELPRFRLIVSYSEDVSRVTDVICALRDRPWPPSQDPPPPHPSPTTIAALLGKPLRSAEFRRAFAPLGVQYEIDRLGSDGQIDMREEFGFEIHAGFPSAEEDAETTAIFDSIIFYRDRDLDAHGWQGELPFGIRFDDNPPDAIARVPAAPAHRRDQKLSGTALWHFEGCSLHLQYSTLDNLVYRVTLLRRGLVG